MTDCGTNSLLASWNASLGATSYTARVTGPHGFSKSCSSSNLTCYVSGLQCSSQYNITVTSQVDLCTSSDTQTVISTGEYHENIGLLMRSLLFTSNTPCNTQPLSISHTRTVRPCKCDQYSSLRLQRGHSGLGPRRRGCGLHCVCSSEQHATFLQEQHNILFAKPAAVWESLQPDRDSGERHHL